MFYIIISFGDITIAMMNKIPRHIKRNNLIIILKNIIINNIN